jgi:D-sedoheptulose 7-phosphate isomerase
MAYFPNHIYIDAAIYLEDYFQLHSDSIKIMDKKCIASAGELLLKAVGNGKRIFSCGNGGSAAISNHLVCDYVKNVRTNTSVQPKAFSLSGSSELITAIANDFSFDDVFSYQLESLAEEGDVLIAISSSGASLNIINAIKKAKEKGLTTIAMTGFDGGSAAKLADISLHVPAHNYGVVEDIHQSLMHILSQFLRVTHFERSAELGSTMF